jgi:hypothetical protein
VRVGFNIHILYNNPKGRKYKLKELFKVFYEVGIKQVLVYFAIFAAIGFMINRFIPAALIMKYSAQAISLKYHCLQ